MLRQYPTLLLLLFLLICFTATKSLSKKTNIQQPFTESLYSLEYFKTKADESWDMLYSSCPEKGLQELKMNIDFSSFERTQKICDQYRSDILLYLNKLDQKGKTSLLKKIVSENCKVLQDNVNLSNLKRYYHLYCIDFAEKEIAKLNQLAIAHQ